MMFAEKLDAIRARHDDRVWRQAYHQMAKQLMKLDYQSRLILYQRLAGELEYGLCPCGHGLVIVVLNHSPWDRSAWSRMQSRATISCDRCHSQYAVNVQASPRTTNILQGDLQVDLRAYRDGLLWHAEVRPGYLWKMESVLGES